MYSTETGVVIGVHVAGRLAQTVVEQQRFFHRSGLTIIVPAFYVVELLKHYRVNWDEHGE